MYARNKFIGSVALVGLFVSFGFDRVGAQTPTPSFAFVGHLERLEIADLADPLSAGSMVVSGTRITLPRNLLVKLPGQYMTVNDLFRGKHPGKVPALSAASRPSGLALLDSPPQKPALPFEVEVIGNIVGAEYIAGWVSIAQVGLQTGAGFIQSIDYATGALMVGSGSGASMVKVRINDSRGTYGKPNAAKGAGSVMDDRFAADPGNAPIVSQTGFPMCIPLSAAGDPNCPLANRGSGNESRFTCGPASVDPTAPARPTCDPGRKAPVVVGDYITYSGMLTEETPGAGNFFIAAHAISTLTGIYTSPGANPAYVFIEEALVGTLGAPFPPPNDNQEQTSRFRLVGFTTDPTRRVDIFLIDTSQGNPDEQERRLTTLDPQRVGQIGRIRVTLPAKANFLPVTRDVRIRIEGHSSIKVANGLDSGQYTAPVAEYIYPENTRWGVPRFPIAIPFENFCFLKQGGGTLGTLGRDELPNPHPLRPAIGALLPFPNSGQATQVKADGTSACP
ncbi:MAG: hypothetical protein LZF60_310135 [Nitrospira sp.]|nr:hypothetical protein [Nitrospira sp.]ULA61234.1 MAG: hypothetical protein LZF60_310135 [Nitrospira sp.]